MSVNVRSAAANDSEALAKIYNYYIRETAVTFEEAELSAQQMAIRIGDIVGVPLPWLVAEDHGAIIGYASASKWKVRSAYRYSVETTIYLDPERTGRGAGTRLYSELLSVLRSQSLHTAIGGIALPNAASVALHEKLGFTNVACFREVGFKFGRWIDVGYWQKAL